MNQERDQELALSRGLQLAYRDEQHEPLYGSNEALIRQVPLAVLLLLLLLGPPVDAAQGGFGISLASHRWPEAEAAAVEAAGHHLGTCRNVSKIEDDISKPHLMGPLSSR